MNQTIRRFVRGPDISFEFCDQIFQRERDQPAENVTMGSFQRIARLLMAMTRRKTLVMIDRAVVVTHRGEIDQAGEVARDLRERTPLKVLDCAPHCHELGWVTH
ncbi:MAG TPA: hypothetical protein VFI38_05475 [Candidatus Acidoferrum sp.]|nr:hypothetical protein [Candidatus Acidoferrum sp.]